MLWEDGFSALNLKPAHNPGGHKNPVDVICRPGPWEAMCLWSRGQVEMRWVIWKYIGLCGVV